MLLRRDHPLLAGCRLLLWPDGRYHSNLVGYDPDPTVTGTPLAGGGSAQYPAVTLDGSSYYAVGAFQDYGSGGKDITIVARLRPTAAPASGNYATILCARTGVPASHGFNFWLGNTSGLGENAWTFAVHGGGTAIVISDTVAASTYLNLDAIVVVRYDSITRTADLWVNGEKRASNTDVSNDWDPWGTSGVLTVGFHGEGSGVGFQGDIGPLLVYDRVLTDGEVLEAMQDHDWEFLRDDDATYFTPVFVSYATSVSLAGATGLSGAVAYFTELDASADFTGDLSSVPDPAGDVLYVTTVNLRSVGLGNTPEFARYVTSVGVTQVYSPTQPIHYTTQVLVSPHRTFRIDGRTDLLDTFRYRR